MSYGEPVVDVELKLETGREFLLRQLREVKNLRGEPVYRNAEIDIRIFNPGDLKPTAKYLMESNMEFLEAMYNDLLSKGIDIFNLESVIETDYGVVGPPVVEVAEDASGNRVPAIVDGSHRVALAKYLKKDISVIYVNGANPEYPLIGLPVGWEKVRTYKIKPTKEEDLRDLKPGMVGLEDKASLFRDITMVGSSGRKLLSWQTG